MSKNTYKSAAVPFVNQKGERSMKRVKVERYVAGKKPSYAREEDEDDEYYTTDEEEENEDLSQHEDDSVDDEKVNLQDDHRLRTDDDRKRRIRMDRDEDDDSPHSEKPNPSLKQESHSDHGPSGQDDDGPNNDEDDDDPRFRRLKQLESTKPDPSRLLNVQQQSTSTNSNAYQTLDEQLLAEAAEDDEEEEDVRQRHALARARTLEEPLGPQALFGDLADHRQLAGGADSGDEDAVRFRHEQTDDILRDFKLTAIKPKHKRAKEQEENERKLKEMLEEVKGRSVFEAQVNKRVEEDKKREEEREAAKKDGVASRDMMAVNTDDEDEEVAYEEWKLREIKRVLRDRSERKILETEAKC